MTLYLIHFEKKYKNSHELTNYRFKFNRMSTSGVVVFPAAIINHNTTTKGTNTYHY